VGIDGSELPRIFDRFYRGSRANEARGSGSGLGLAIVKSIVDMHGGRIGVESLIGGGTTFTVTLPEDAALPVTEPDEGTVPAAGEPVPPEAWAAPVPPQDGSSERDPAPRAESEEPPLEGIANVVDSSPSPDSDLNTRPSG